MVWGYFTYLPQELDELESIWLKQEQEAAAKRAVKLAAKKAEEEKAENNSSQSFLPGDAKKGAGLFKVGYNHQ